MPQRNDGRRGGVQRSSDRARGGHWEPFRVSCCAARLVSALRARRYRVFRTGGNAFATRHYCTPARASLNVHRSTYRSHPLPAKGSRYRDQNQRHSPSSQHRRDLRTLRRAAPCGATPRICGSPAQISHSRNGGRFHRSLALVLRRIFDESLPRLLLHYSVL